MTLENAHGRDEAIEALSRSYPGLEFSKQSDAMVVNATQNGKTVAITLVEIEDNSWEKITQKIRNAFGVEPE